MDYFFVNTMPMADRAACLLELYPDDTEPFHFLMEEGEPVASEYPPNPPVWRMSDEYPGRPKVLDVIDNTSGMLIVRRPVRAVLEATGVPMECLPFTLVDHRGRVASTEHFIVNPLGGLDCLNLARCEIEYSKEYPDEILGIDRYVLDPRKLEQAPDFFRVKENRRTYVVSHRLVERLRPLDPSNLFLKKIDQEA